MLSFVHFPVAHFSWIGDQPTRFRSSEYAERGFCSKCGSTLSMHEQVLGDRVQVALGSLDEPERVRIQDHVWTQDSIPWFKITDELPRFERSSSAVPTLAGE